MFSVNKKENNTTQKLLNEAITSIIGEDMNITGDLISNTSIRIDGKVVGNITTQKLIIVGEKASIKGDLSSKNVIVFGRLDGNVIAGEVQIKKSGVINGDISVQAIEIEMGGKYNGKLMMNAEQREMNEKLKAKELKNGVIID
jgi:cytoskeletal protein CcmA (bactofilin family)